MKKLASVIVASTLLATSITSVSAQTGTTDTANTATPAAVTTTATTAPANDPFANLTETSIGTSDATVTKKEVTSALTLKKVGEDKVELTVSLDTEAVKAKTSKIAVKFPDVVTITDKDVTKGDLFDKGTVEIKGNTLTYSSESLTAIPSKGTVLKAVFTVKPSTAKQAYPFTIDATASKLSNELNEDVTVMVDGVKTIELETATPEVKEVVKETGFEESAALLAILGTSATAFVASRRRKSI